MNAQLLIDAVVRQTTVLIAQLATSGGARAPLADVANRVFADLTRELQRQGVSRKVAADMFGMALRTYRRRVQRLAESQTFSGRSLWEAIYDYIGQKPVATRADVLRRFDRDDDEIVRGILQDLVDNGLVYAAGRRETSSYRLATRDDLDYLRSADDNTEGVDTLVWGIVYRRGPIDRATLGEQIGLPSAKLDESLKRLLGEGKIAYSEGEGWYRSDDFVIPLDEPVGWEAAVFDHFQAVVTTICAKLRRDASSVKSNDHTGGSTYTVEVWPGHPLESEALGFLAGFRARARDLRERAAEYNAEHAMPEARSRVLIYGGQCLVDYKEEELDERR